MPGRLPGGLPVPLLRLHDELSAVQPPPQPANLGSCVPVVPADATAAWSAHPPSQAVICSFVTPAAATPPSLELPATDPPALTLTMASM